MNTPTHHPHTKEVEDDSPGTCCFMNSERVCGPDCMAYVAPIEKPEHVDFIGKEWSKCHILINLHRGGKHLVVLADVATKILKGINDTKRTNQPEPKL